MNRLAVGAALGGLAVYLYDPELGEERRGRLSSLWQENRESALQAGRAASEAVESARPLARRMTKAMGRGDWARALDRGRHATSLPRLIGAAAVGGLVVYFMDPVKGSERRLSALETGRLAVRRMANAIKPLPGRVGDHVAGAVEGVTSKVS
ncbi:MAG: YtxH domain-containing protein [Candidatus Dormibacteraeota bacterium]|nr:YtxH domain-containing protein [Candidatus Dormibacteraeota bacterium]